jgi:hypothetical protein
VKTATATIATTHRTDAIVVAAHGEHDLSPHSLEASRRSAHKSSELSQHIRTHRLQPDADVATTHRPTGTPMMALGLDCERA